jgi:hypothetical protein
MIGQDKVKQCIDPRLKREYPPKGGPEAYLPHSLSVYDILHCFVFIILMNNGVTDETP